MNESDKFSPHSSLADFLSELRFKPIAEHPDSPISGDVIKYKDGSIAIVGTASCVSYGSRAEMLEVARLFPRPVLAENPQRHDDVPVTHDEESATRAALNPKADDEIPALLKERA